MPYNRDKDLAQSKEMAIDEPTLVMMRQNGIGEFMKQTKIYENGLRLIFEKNCVVCDKKMLVLYIGLFMRLFFL